MPPSSSNSATQYDQTQLGRPAYSQMNGPVLPSTAPAHTMYESLLIALASWGLTNYHMNGQVLSSTVPVHRMYQILLIVFLYWEAGPLPAAPAKGSSALNYRACAQNVSDISSSFHILGGWRLACSQMEVEVLSQVQCLRTECIRCYS